MSWLYEHRDQLNGYSRVVEIAHSVTYSIPPFDRDDLEQQIVLVLIEIKNKEDDYPEAYLWKAARTKVKEYWLDTYRREGKLLYIKSTNRGEQITKPQKALASPEEDIDARLDAAAILATLPPRLREIGVRRLDKVPLSNADRLYWHKQKRKLRPACKGRLTRMDRQKIEELNQKGLLTREISRITGWSEFTIRAVLNEAGLKSPLRPRMERARIEKEEIIKRHLVEGKSITRIARDTHTWKKTVREVARAFASEETDKRVDLPAWFEL
jgi:hypothetical protein